MLQCITENLLRFKEHDQLVQQCILALTNLLCDGGDNVKQMVEAGGIDALEAALVVRAPMLS